MKNYKEFINEASISDVKAAAIAGVQSGKYKYKNDEESRFQFARDMKDEGFTGNVVSNAWKSSVVTGEIFNSPSKKDTSKKATKVENKPDTKSIEAKYNSILKELQIIKSEGQKISAAYKSIGGNIAIHAQDVGYVDDLVKIIKSRIWSIKQLK